MMTPLMLLLSSISPSLEYDHPVDTMYLSRDDRNLMLKEANRLGELICDDSQILMTTDLCGNEVCDTAQFVNNISVEISPATAVIMTRLRKCVEVFRKNTQAVEDDGSYDIDTDTVILKLEGNPRYVYAYVYMTMENNSMDYRPRILRLAELYNALVGFNSQGTTGDKQSFLVSRFKEQGDLSFWQRLVYHDWMQRELVAPAPITLESLRVVKRELRDMGFYGFVNPWTMYTEFAGARVNRKVELNVGEEVTSFLRKVVLSGGVQV